MQDDEKKKTFFQLLKDYNIKIPIIQRDYAQGRQNEKANAVRKNIIQALKNSLENNTNLDLNFVYGIVQKADDILTFLPVDGQQRLTTLYLMYYYFFVVNGKIEDFNKQCKSFTYTTRTSATEFFSWLREGSKEVMNALASEGNDLKNIICNTPSYQAAWNNDPTVISAITMLAAIKESVGKDFAEKFYDRLIDEKCPITFSVIMEEAKENAEMNEDKAYIRMNARGKTLEDFENLRSMIDGIDQEKVNIIANYDQIYLDKIYNACKCNGNSTLKAITQNMNQISYAAFMNVYNIVALSFGGIDFKNNEVEYRNYMYECSKRTQDIKDTTLETYIAVLDTYFEYCTSLETFEYNNCIFCKNSIQKNISNEDKNVITEVLYCYFYKKQKGKVATKRQVEDFIYVLDNLDKKNWTNFYVNIKKFCEKIAQYNNVFEFFLNLDIENRDEDETLRVGISDLSVRLKEQVIKTKIIQYEINNGNANNVDYRYFEQYECLCPERKLQFFLYITECWEKLSLNSETFDHFITNLNKGKKWFFDKKTEELEFLKLYAMAANMDEANQLAEPDTVNKNCTRNNHIWDRSVCFWSDEDEYNPVLSSKWKEKCALAKKTYCMEEQCFTTAKNVLLQSKYNHCWLKYAVKNDYRELMEQRLGLDEKNNVIIYLDDRWKKYLMYVYILKNTSITWGETVYMKSNVKTMQIPYGDILLPISKKTVPVENTFNATLQWKTFLTIQDKEPIDENDCMYLIEDRRSDNTYVYKRFIYQCNNPSELLLEEYDIIEDVNNLDNEHELESKKVNSFDLDVFLELYEEYYNREKYLSGRITVDYYRGQGNSRTWTREREIISYAKAKTSKVQI